MIRAVFFDVMGTIVNEPFYRAVPEFFGVSLDELRAIKHPSSWLEFERGRIDEATYIGQFFTDGRPLDAAGLKRAMYEAYTFLEGTEEILCDLKQRNLPLYALSNYSPWYQMIEQKLALSRYLDWRFVSCLTGHRKPEPEAFLNAARSIGLTTLECLFIDDRPVNVAAAEGLGMQAIHFHDGAKLRQELEARGLL